MNSMTYSAWSSMVCFAAFGNPRSLRSLGKSGASLDHVLEHVNKMDIYKSERPDRIQPRVLRELADINVRPPCIILERSW